MHLLIQTKYHSMLTNQPYETQKKKKEKQDEYLTKTRLRNKTN